MPGNSKPWTTRSRFLSIIALVLLDPLPTHWGISQLPDPSKKILISASRFIFFDDDSFSNLPVQF